MTNQFGYNDRHELTSAAMGANTFAYTFDPIGNRETADAQVSGQDPVATAYTANLLNQYTNIVTTVTGQPPVPVAPIHDDDGNLTEDGQWTYTWDAENRLISMEGGATPRRASPATPQRLEFAYDFMSRRISKKVYEWNAVSAEWQEVRATAFVYDAQPSPGGYGSAELSVVGSQSSVVASYVWGLDLSGSQQGAGGVGGLLFTTVHGPQSTVYAAAFDGNGNVSALLDMQTGTLAAAYEYDPFGNTISATGTAAEANVFRFSTKYTGVETGLLYYGYRYYQPGTGRWLSRDPIGERGSTNLYRYTKNSAVVYIDPFGLDIATTAKGVITISYYPDSPLSLVSANPKNQITTTFDVEVNVSSDDNIDVVLKHKKVPNTASEEDQYLYSNNPRLNGEYARTYSTQYGGLAYGLNLGAGLIAHAQGNVSFAPAHNGWENRSPDGAYIRTINNTWSINKSPDGKELWAEARPKQLATRRIGDKCGKVSLWLACRPILYSGNLGGPIDITWTRDKKEPTINITESTPLTAGLVWAAGIGGESNKDAYFDYVFTMGIIGVSPEVGKGFINSIGHYLKMPAMETSHDTIQGAWDAYLKGNK